MKNWAIAQQIGPYGPNGNVVIPRIFYLGKVNYRVINYLIYRNYVSY